MEVQAAPGATPAVSLGRFSGEAVQPLAWPRGRPAGLLALPHVGPASIPWRVAAEDAAGVRTCFNPPSG